MIPADHLITGHSDILSLYLHIPFCKRKCNYCDFVSFAGKEKLMDEYVEFLCKEINSAPSLLFPSPSLIKRGGRDRDGGELKTIYFGGGTPTLLDPTRFNKIITTLISHSSSLDFTRDGWNGEPVEPLVISPLEVSIEANPGTADAKKLEALRRLGINRLSIGAQSFNNKHLKTLGRIHTAEEAIKFYTEARSIGFENINLDLMFALPDQTLEEWKNDLKTALNLKPEHLSIYNLQIEMETPFWHKFNPPPLPLGEGKRGGEGFLSLPTEETELAMFEYTIDTLTAAGYKHYEISNFTKPGFECQHNINYWRNGNYIGIGCGAHSHINGKRWANSNSLDEYLKTAPRLTPNDSPDSTDQRETLFLGLRLLEGLPIERFNNFEKEVKELTEDGLLERSDGKIKLTRRGLFLGNLVFEKFV